jgi:hypothetical protein
MSASLVAITALIGQSTGALGALSSLLNPIPQGNIGGIAVPVTIEEVLTDTLEVTQHPVEAGAEITDHSFMRPAELVMRCGWSNSTPVAALGAAVSLFSGGSLSTSDTVGAIYSQIRAIQLRRQPLSVTTSIRNYTNMLITSVSLTRDKNTSQALMVTATMKQIIIVSTQATTLAPMANQANPAGSAETTNVGPQALISGQTPAPGGAVPPFAWVPAP